MAPESISRSKAVGGSNREPKCNFVATCCLYHSLHCEMSSGDLCWNPEILETPGHQHIFFGRPNLVYYLACLGTTLIASRLYFTMLLGDMVGLLLEEGRYVLSSVPCVTDRPCGWLSQVVPVITSQHVGRRVFSWCQVTTFEVMGSELPLSHRRALRSLSRPPYFPTHFV